jgi:glycosyltransferase involved in cell wall biosynthesis
MNFSFIICTYNRERFLADTLKSVSLVNWDKNDFEIVLIDNASTDSTQEICNSFHELNQDICFNYFLEPNQGLSYARNRGIKEAVGRWLIFIDDDIILDPGYLVALWSGYETFPDTMAHGTKIAIDYTDSPPIWISSFLEPMLGKHSFSDKISIYDGVRFPVGASMGFRREVFEIEKDFNPLLGRKGNALNGSEEKDIFRRIQSKGMVIRFFPDALLYHRIDPFRLTKSYVKKQAVGIGISERIRLSDKGLFLTVIKFLQEIFKMLVSIVLFLYYTLFLRKLEAGKMLLKFRLWIMQGYLRLGDSEI